MNRNIAFIHEDFPMGGAETITAEIGRYMALQNDQIWVFTRLLHNEQLTEELKHYLHFIVLPDKRSIQSEKNAQFIAQEIQKRKIGFFIRPSLYLKRLHYIKEHTSCKIIFALHVTPFWEIENRLIVARERKKRSLGLWLEWIFLRYPKIVWGHSIEKDVIRKYKETLSICDAYVVLCQEYGESIRKKLSLTESSPQITVIPNPVQAPDKVITKKKKQILYVGRLSYADKRVDRLIDIWGKISSEYPDWEAIIVGDGPEMEKLREQSSSYPNARITFKGYQSDVTPYYKDAAILCLTSTSEAWGLTLTQAQANGVAPIAFGCSAGVRSVLSPSGKYGIVVEPYNMKKFSSQLRKLIENDLQREKIQQAVIEKSRNYMLETIGKKWEELFDSIAGNPTKSE